MGLGIELLNRTDCDVLGEETRLETSCVEAALTNWYIVGDKMLVVMPSKMPSKMHVKILW